jgi:hypothetical protein
MFFLWKSYDLKDLEESDVILNIELIKNENGIILHNLINHVETILIIFRFIDNKYSPNPLWPQCDTTKEPKYC